MVIENNVKQLEQLSAQSLAQDAELVELEETIGQLKQLKNELQANEMLLSKQIYFLLSKLAIKADWQTAQRQWLKENDVIENVILQEKIIIEKAWQHAVEMVLSYQLQASCIDKLPFELLENDNTPESLFLISQQPNSSSNQLNNVETLASKISNGDSYIKYLNSIKIADNIEQALTLLPELLDTESVICPQGIWLSRHFIRKGIIGEKNDHFDYQQDLDEQRKKEKEVQSRLKQVEASLFEKNSDKKLLLAQQQTFVHKVSQLKQNVADEKQRQALAQQSTNLLQEQIVRLNCEMSDLVAKQHEVNSRLMMVNSQSADAEIVDKTEIVNTSEDDVHLLSEQLSELQKTIGSAQEQQAALTQEKHTIVMVIEKNKHQIQQLQQNVVRYQESIHQLSVQQTNTNQQINDNTQPLLDDEQKLQNWLQEMSELDGNLQLKQLSLKEEQSKINSIEQTQGQMVELLTKLKEQLSQSQVEAESNRLKAETALEQLAELGKNVNAVLENMPDNARESQWQAQLIVLAKDIQVLGAINLAAIDEYETQLTRKNYLDQQDEDLNLAITTLESAIEKIDKESRHKFKLTFDKVNQDLQSLFPKVFGGGQAYLTLTGDDLLDTGITIMARPPGKKNSTIHLLSGGEKALTALSLVFAIFRLNPAPFCMLDEVDAPLDDANVSRFCNLVKEMSQTVQFIYISHNKIAMEMATHLTGITMFEAGVSRMVSVDIDEAVAMAEVS